MPPPLTKCSSLTNYLYALCSLMKMLSRVSQITSTLLQLQCQALTYIFQRWESRLSENAQDFIFSDSFRLIFNSNPFVLFLEKKSSFICLVNITSISNVINNFNTLTMKYLSFWLLNVSKFCFQKFCLGWSTDLHVIFLVTKPCPPRPIKDIHSPS